MKLEIQCSTNGDKDGMGKKQSLFFFYDLTQHKLMAHFYKFMWSAFKLLLVGNLVILLLYYAGEDVYDMFEMLPV